MTSMPRVSNRRLQIFAAVALGTCVFSTPALATAGHAAPMQRHQERYAALGQSESSATTTGGATFSAKSDEDARNAARVAGRGYRWEPLTSHLPPALTCVSADFNLRGSLVGYSDNLTPGWRFIRDGKDVPLSPTAEGVTYSVVRPYRLNQNDQVAGIVRSVDDQGREHARAARWSPDGTVTVAPSSTPNNEMDDLRVLATNAKGDMVFDSRTANSAGLWEVDKGAIHEIKVPAGFREFLPDGLTDAGDVTGSLVKEEANPAQSQAVTWNPTTGWNFFKGINGSDEGYIGATSPNGQHLIGGSSGTINPYDDVFMVRFQGGAPASLVLPTTNEHAKRYPHSVNNLGTVMVTSMYDANPTIIDGDRIIDVASVTTGTAEGAIMVVTRLDDHGRILASMNKLNPSPGVQNVCQVGMLVPFDN